MTEPNMKITLIGYRGCGKSSVAPLLAQRLGLPYYDCDQEIETRTQKSIYDIFTDDGEAEFRRIEEDVLAQLLSGPPAVIAAGGGAVLTADNRRRMQQAGPVIWLKATVPTLASRIGNDETAGKSRPSLTGQTVQQEVARVLDQRLPLYSATASICIDTESKPPDQIADEIISCLNFAHGDATDGRS